jgi:hypothetical protein
MVLGAPRSGTSWASVWLTTDKTLCLHDPLFGQHYSALDEIESERTLGIACTGCALFPQWVNQHPARKLILRRDLKEIDESSARIGMPPVSEAWEGVLDRIQGLHVPWTYLWDRPKEVYEYLLDAPFDTDRHALLKGMNIQRDMKQVSFDRSITTRLLKELEYSRAN